MEGISREMFNVMSFIIYKISGRVSSTCVPLSLNRFYVLQDKMKKDENGVGKEV